jgi:A/G-specific adenine glycosylase
LKIDDVISRRAALLDWYDIQGRKLPWRLRPEDRAGGQTIDPYSVWLSEIMLQQTTVLHATPYWEKFLKRWPRVNDLAAADRDDVLAAWAGLGYYARVRNLHKCAQTIVAEFGGQFPSELTALLSLPGVGEYTANAIRAAAFNQPASVVDGNVERVISRQFAIETPLPKAKHEIKKIAGQIADPDRPCDYAQAIMDLGATVCSPKSPDCPECPWKSTCKALECGQVTRFPIKEKKKPKPVRYGVCFRVISDDRIWLKRRPDTGLLGAMMEVPGTGWTEDGIKARKIGLAMPFNAEWRDVGEVRHVFTHFELHLTVLSAIAPSQWSPAEGAFHAISELKEVGLPSVMMKAAKLGLETRLL